MNVIGTAYVTIQALTDRFESSLKAGTDPALAGFGTTAGKAGETAGEGLAGGLSTGTKTIEKDLETKGAAGGSKLTSGLARGLSGIGNVVNNFTGGMLPITQATDKMAEHLKGASGGADTFAGKLQNLGGGVALGAAAGIAVFSGVAIHMYESFQTATAQIAASGDITQKTATDIGKAFLSTGGTVTFTAQEMATAFAGVAGQVKEINGGTITTQASMMLMKSSMDLAEASGGNLTGTTKSMTGVLQAFNMGVSSSPLVSNILFNAARDTGQSVEAMGAKIAMAKSRMGAAAPTIQEMGGLLVDLTNHGETGRAAMAVLSSAFTGILTPSAKVTAAQQALGLSFLDSQGKLKPIGDVMDQAKKAIAGMGDSQAITTLKSIGFGGASSKLLSTIQAGGATFNKYKDEVDRTGSAHEAAEKKSDTLHGQMQKLKGAVADSAVQWGSVLLPVLTKIGSKFAEVSLFIIHHKEVLIALGLVVGTVLVVAITAYIVKLLVATALTIAHGVEMTIMGIKAAAAWIMALGPISLIIIAIVAIAAVVAIVVALIIKHWKQVWGEVKRIVEPVWKFIYGVFEDVKNWVMDAVNFIKSHWELLVAILAGPIGLAIFFIIKHFDQIKKVAMEVVTAIGGFFSSLPGKIAGFFTGIWDKVWADMMKVAEWLDVHVWKPVETFFKNIPGKVAAAVTGWWDTAWAELMKISLWIYNNIELPVINWFKAIPGKVATSVTGWWNTAWAEVMKIGLWIYTNIELPVINFFKAIPGKVKDAVVNWWDTAWADVMKIESWIYNKIELPVINWFKAIPGKVASSVTGWWNTAWAEVSKIGEWLEKNVWTPIKNFFTGLPGRIAHAAGNLLGGIGGAIGGLFSAEGGVFTRPTATIVGEAGAEVILPLTKPARMAQILGSLPVGLMPGGNGNSSSNLTSPSTSITATNTAPVINTEINIVFNGVDTSNSDQVRAIVDQALEQHTTDVLNALTARTGQ